MTRIAPYRRIGRYVLGPPIASGGMGAVCLGHLRDLSRVVAVKQLRAECAQDPLLVNMFLDEILLLARIRHKNVVAPIELLEQNGEFFIVMEYVEGESLSRLLDVVEEPFPPPLASKIITDVLIGLHAAHEATDVGGQPLGIVHRDVSPQNIIVGTDGAARVIDFGIAKAAMRAPTTEFGQLKGKPRYMAPEQLAFEPADARTDLYSAAVVLWELLTGRQLFAQARTLGAQNCDNVRCPSTIVDGLPRAVAAVVSRALARHRADRYPDARAMADALMDAVPPWRDLQAGDWVSRVARDALELRSRDVKELETVSLSEVIDDCAKSMQVDRDWRRSALVSGHGSDREPANQSREPSEGSVMSNAEELPVAASTPVWKLLAVIVASVAMSLVATRLAMRAGFLETRTAGPPYLAPALPVGGVGGAFTTSLGAEQPVQQAGREPAPTSTSLQAGPLQGRPDRFRDESLRRREPRSGPSSVAPLRAAKSSGAERAVEPKEGGNSRAAAPATSTQSASTDPPIQSASGPVEQARTPSNDYDPLRDQRRR